LGGFLFFFFCGLGGLVCFFSFVGVFFFFFFFLGFFFFFFFFFCWCLLVFFFFFFFFQKRQAAKVLELVPHLSPFPFEVFDDVEGPFPPLASQIPKKALPPSRRGEHLRDALRMVFFRERRLVLPHRLFHTSGHGF